MLNGRRTHSLAANAALPLLLMAALVIFAACGGGSSVPANNGPSWASLQGQVLEDSGGRVTSATTVGVAGAEVSLIETSTGELIGTDVTDGSGSFEFPAISTTTDQVVQVQVASDNDLDSDGESDLITVIYPLELDNPSMYFLSEMLSSVDSDQDGQNESIKVEIGLQDGSGQVDGSLSQMNYETDESVNDEDGDGDLDDEQGFLDANHDGLPDNLVGNQNALHGGQLRGPIVELTDESITLNGITFLLTDATQWKDMGNKNPDPEVFGEGVMVKVHGLWNGEDWIALEVKTSGPRSGGDDEEFGGDDAGGDDDGGDDDVGGDDGDDGDDGGDDVGGDDDGGDDGGDGGDDGSGDGDDDSSDDDGEGEGAL